MKLWKISQRENMSYDTFDSAVVTAEDAEAARRVHPLDACWDWEREKSWASKPENVKAEYIGEAADGIKAGTVIVASFHAG
jgi:hypothetical protein